MNAAMIDIPHEIAKTERTLLIVEDDKSFLQRLARAMESRGFIVMTAESVAWNLERYRTAADLAGKRYTSTWTVRPRERGAMGTLHRATATGVVEPPRARSRLRRPGLRCRGAGQAAAFGRMRQACRSGK